MPAATVDKNTTALAQTTNISWILRAPVSSIIMRWQRPGKYPCLKETRSSFFMPKRKQEHNLSSLPAPHHGNKTKIPSFLFYLYLVLHPTYVAYVLVLHGGRAVL